MNVRLPRLEAQGQRAVVPLGLAVDQSCGPVGERALHLNLRRCLCEHPRRSWTARCAALRIVRDLMLKGRSRFGELLEGGEEHRLQHPDRSVGAD